MKKEQILPEWFDGEIYKEGGTVANRFTGEEYELNNLELSMNIYYFFTKYCLFSCIHTTIF